MLGIRTTRIVLVLIAISTVLPVPCADSDRQATVEELGWMAGSWSARRVHGGDDGSRWTEYEEHWIVPKAGLMLGLHRDVSSSGRVDFEYLRIEQSADGPVYLASPSGREPTPFPLVDSGKQRAVFANPQHDFPKRITYWLRDSATLCARVEGDPGGKVLEWCWDRAAPETD